MFSKMGVTLVTLGQFHGGFLYAVTPYYTNTYGTEKYPR